jgi:hypothetical protein
MQLPLPPKYTCHVKSRVAWRPASFGTQLIRVGLRGALYYYCGVWLPGELPLPRPPRVWGFWPPLNANRQPPKPGGSGGREPPPGERHPLALPDLFKYLFLFFVFCKKKKRGPPPDRPRTNIGWTWPDLAGPEPPGDNSTQRPNREVQIHTVQKSATLVNIKLPQPKHSHGFQQNSHNRCCTIP